MTDTDEKTMFPPEYHSDVVSVIPGNLASVNDGPVNVYQTVEDKVYEFEIFCNQSSHV